MVPETIRRLCVRLVRLAGIAIRGQCVEPISRWALAVSVSWMGSRPLREGIGQILSLLYPGEPLP